MIRPSQTSATVVKITRKKMWPTDESGRAGLAPAKRGPGVDDTTRDVIRGLHPAGIDQLGLVAAVRGLLVDIEVEEGLTTELAVTGEVARGTPETEVGVFRIVQEAVRNVVRHAGANRLSVELAYDKGVVRMIVTDDGRGFDHAGAARPVAGSHLGILGMRERASLLDGHCDVLSAPGHGAVVEATVPLQRALKGAIIRVAPQAAAR